MEKTNPLVERTPKSPGGFFQKLIKFAVDNPMVTVMGALVALGVLLPEERGNCKESHGKHKGKRKGKKQVPRINPGRFEPKTTHHGISHITGKRY